MGIGRSSTEDCASKEGAAKTMRDAQMMAEKTVSLLAQLLASQNENVKTTLHPQSQPLPSIVVDRAKLLKDNLGNLFCRISGQVPLLPKLTNPESARLSCGGSGGTHEIADSAVSRVVGNHCCAVLDDAGLRPRPCRRTHRRISPDLSLNSRRARVVEQYQWLCPYRWLGSQRSES